MGFLRILAVLGAMVLVAACADNLDKPSDLNEVAAPTSLFDKEMFRLYRWLAEKEAQEGDHEAAHWFVQKAKASATGAVPAPDNLSDRSIPAGAQSELSDARQRLVDALAGGAATSNPEYAAFAQAMFDCWLQEQEENFQPKHIEMCKECFEIAMKALGEPAPMMQKTSMTAPECETRAFLVFFDFNSSEVAIEGEEVINLAVEYLQQDECRAAQVDVIGHTDTMGSRAYNQALSLRRSDRVVTLLTQKGIPTSQIAASAAGEEKLRIQTADEVREAENRRVEINIK